MSVDGAIIRARAARRTISDCGTVRRHVKGPRRVSADAAVPPLYTTGYVVLDTCAWCGVRRGGVMSGVRAATAVMEDNKPLRWRLAVTQRLVLGGNVSRCLAPGWGRGDADYMSRAMRHNGRDLLTWRRLGPASLRPAPH